MCTYKANPKRSLTGRKHLDRRGVILVFAAVMLLISFAFAAFVVDFGMVTLTKGQMQNAADSAAHAATLEIARSFGPGNELTVDQAESIARARAVEMISKFRTGDVAATDAHQVRDIRVGRRSWNDSDKEWEDEWGVSPYNMVEVTVRRTNTDTTALPMTFAKLLGRENFELTTTSVYALQPGNGFTLPPGTPPSDTIHLLPIALDLGSWSNLLDQVYGTSTSSACGNVGTGQGANANSFDDEYAWNANDRVVEADESDGILEINIYPDLNSGLAPGNRGTVDLGHAGNSTSDLKRQIRYGLNSYDLSFFPNNRITFDSSGALYLNGDTGISAGIKDALEDIIGQVRAIPIFISVTGQGNNATYTIVKFVGVRIMGVKLTGGPNSRHLTVQPAVFSDSHVLRGDLSVNVDSILSQPVPVH
ncbi:pilus assembly protein TadG-related protein [Fuerstiella marisgermanici]|uniref:Putative membrane protein n=1 Tax=Fuerstiella marisgermanici TaxID=1891926 RepID=A0A1P8WGN5_9PLAN|nr:pilus assembly protein TadG-related protein [Fuerstiella marisgermanici]APZ93202.1 putative membrane protein [Fuerstiella marisgermanici]